MKDNVFIVERDRDSKEIPAISQEKIEVAKANIAPLLTDSYSGGISMENNEKYQVTVSTIVRTVCLALAFVNLILTSTGHSPLPFEDQAVAQFVADAFVTITAIVAWWKNNSFTQKAIKADKTFKG